ncbi:MAG: hypothetical protein F4Z60_12440 [Chloroflexi bacterium]|nr:hypothetical protein [Chloroflexota bacterium]
MISDGEHFRLASRRRPAAWRAGRNSWKAGCTGGVYETITTATGKPEWLRRYAERLNAHYAEVSKRYRVLYEPPNPRGAQISAGARPGVNIRLSVDLRLEQ